jgi:hypothetical protein
MWNRDIANSSPDIDAANGVLEGSPLTLTLSLIHTLNFVVSQTDSLPSSVTWKNDTCMFNNAITIFRPCRFSTNTMLYLWSPWFVCHIEQEHRYCLTLLLLLRTTSLCRVVLPLTVIMYIYSYLVRTSHKCHNSLFQSPRSMGTLTVIHLSHACGIPSLTSSLTVPHPALFCHTSTAPYVMHYNFMLNTQVQSAELRKLHNTVTMARHCCPGRDDTLRHMLAGLSVRYKCITFLLNTHK